MNSNFGTKKIKDLIEEVSVRNNRNEGGDVYSVTASDGFIKSTDYFDKKVFSKNISNYKIVRPGQFAYNPSRINVGSIDFLQHDTSVVVSPLYVVFACREHLIADYLFRYLKSSIGKTQIRNKTKGTIRDNLSFESLGEIVIPLPSVIDQIKISKLLSTIETLIAKRNESIKLIDNFLKSQFNKLFGDPVVNPKKWKKMPFSNVARNENSKRIPLNQSDRDKRSGEFPYYGATGIIDSIDEYIFDGDFLLIAEDGKNLMLRKKNNAFFVTGKFWVNNHAHILASNGITNLRYLEFFLNYIDLKPFLTGIDQVKLNKENLDKIQVPVPPIEMQNRFELIVAKSGKVKTNLADSLTSLENFYTSLSYRAFRGELDLSKIFIEHNAPSITSEISNTENIRITAKSQNERSENTTENILKTVIRTHFTTNPFSFEDLAQKIQANMDGEIYSYTKIKNMVFDCLKGKGDILLKQFFKKNEKKLFLQAIK